MRPQRTQAEIAAALAQYQTRQSEEVLTVANQEVAADWHAQKACTVQGTDPVLFDAPSRSELTREREVRERAAKAICKVCPVSVLCLTETLEAEKTTMGAAQLRPVFGIRAGLNYQERRRLGMSRPKSR